jgi:hypothetical protein
VLVMRNGVEIGRARLEIREPEVPPGTHAYVLTADYLDVPHPWAPQVPMGKWLAVAVPGHFDEAGRALSTMLVTDAPILSENSAADFTVLSDGPPES